jgi:geranylgeranyl diphosphate synthase type II
MIKEAFTKSAEQVLSPYKLHFEEKMARAFDQFEPKNGLQEAIVYALSGNGKRFRPALVYMIAEALNNKIDVTPSALAVEYFHTASLVADDLPCMDNDDMRRGRATTHKIYGEAVALLASYAMIAAGFEQIALNGDEMKKAGGTIAEKSSEVAQAAVVLAAKSMGSQGLIGGQYFDLFPKGNDLENVLEVIELKTVTLFDLPFTLGWLFGGGERSKLENVHRAALHFGVAFQILDDLDDMEKDRLHGSQANYANRFGKEQAALEVQKHVELFQETMKALKIHSQPLSFLAQGLNSLSKAFMM